MESTEAIRTLYSQIQHWKGRDKLGWIAKISHRQKKTLNWTVVLWIGELLHDFVMMSLVETKKTYFHFSIACERNICWYMRGKSIKYVRKKWKIWNFSNFNLFCPTLYAKVFFFNFEGRIVLINVTSHQFLAFLGSYIFL